MNERCDARRCQGMDAMRGDTRRRGCAEFARWRQSQRQTKATRPIGREFRDCGGPANAPAENGAEPHCAIGNASESTPVACAPGA
jgi:hypothetical protein